MANCLLLKTTPSAGSFHRYSSTNNNHIAGYRLLDLRLIPLRIRLRWERPNLHPVQGQPRLLNPVDQHRLLDGLPDLGLHPVGSIQAGVGSDLDEPAIGTVR